LYTPKVCTTGGWKDIFMRHPLLRLVFVALLAVLATPSAVWAQVQAAPPISGKVPHSVKWPRLWVVSGEERAQTCHETGDGVSGVTVGSVDLCWTGRSAGIHALRQLGWSFLDDDRMRPRGGNSGIGLAEAGC
jgi:hypothetical protein